MKRCSGLRPLAIAIVNEPSKEVQLIAPPGTEVKEKIDAIVADCKQRFQQRASAW